MNLNKLVFVVTLYSYYILVSVSHHHVDANGGDTPAAAMYYLDDVAINCGTLDNSTALDGRDWIGETASKFLSSLQPKGKSRSSTVVHKFKSADSVPYMTARISATPFHYTFRVNPGQKFIRLHFYPALYRGFEKSLDFFTVKAGPFTLLKDFSASVDADASGAKYLVKEFCLIVDENVELKITFSPFQGSNIYAFVNGIEIISMPTGLYYTPPGDLGARVVGLNNQLYIIDKSTALEAIQRLNIGGSPILSVEDFGMFRRWNEDANYLLESKVHRVNHLVLKMKYVPAFIAPPKLYQTSWKTGRNAGVSQIHSFTWKIPIDLGFAYLIRLHFCQLDVGMTESGQREFSVLINNEIAETRANVIRWSGGIGIPVYKDYVVIMKADKESSKYDLLIVLQSADQLVFGLLNGLEIFKLSNLENSFATPNPSFPKRVSTSWNLKNQKVFLSFSQSNVIATGMTILIILVSILVYNLRQIWEEKFHKEKDARAATAEPSRCCFSLAEIRLATQNFSEALVIGRGGFGEVYKGSISGISEIVAIKRLASNSRQGAQEFWTEIKTLSKLRHINLVPLIGYCDESKEMILIYEYMPRGTLADHLYRNGRKVEDWAPLSWEKRLRICIGAAQGLGYLHTSAKNGIIHRDVKDTNILLDEHFQAKISDFGLCKLEEITETKSYVSTNVKGTFGYLDPDYFRARRLTRKSDVYSFGVVLLVIVSGRPVVDTTKPKEQESLLLFYQECIAEGDISRMVDSNIQGKISPDSLKEFAKTVEKCLHQQPKKRPTMAQVVAGLEQALEHQERPMFSVSEDDATVVGQSLEEGEIELIQFSQSQESEVLERRIISSPKEGTSTLPQNPPTSPTGGKDLQSRGNDCASVRKPIWGWLWKAVWNKRKPMKSTSIDEQRNKHSPSCSVAQQPNKEFGTHFSIEDIRNATGNFIDGFFIVDGGGRQRKACIGSLWQHPELTVSIYQYDVEMHVEEILELCCEIERLSQLRHPNLVSLIGYCYHKPARQIFLVHDHIGSGTLHSYLYGGKSIHHLSWKRRLHICIGVAQGLHYLHKGTGQTFVHSDLRPANILLDRDFTPKILNYGLSQLSPIGNLESATNRIELAWLEYLSPEAISSGLQSSHKSDVYSFGLVLLELLCSQTRRSFHLYPGGVERHLKIWLKQNIKTKRKNFHVSHGDDERYLKNWVKQNIKTKRFHQFLDSSLQRKIAATCLAEFIKIAFSCLHFQEKKRPSMGHVTGKLKFALQLQEEAEARMQDFKGKGADDVFNLEDIYQDTPYLDRTWSF